MAVTQDGNSSDPPLPPLLNLPAELRNSIYRLCLTGEEPTTATSSFRVPPLLQANHQIRHEAASIYFLENIFFVHFEDFDPALGEAFRDHPFAKQYARAMVRSGKLWAIVWPPRMNWANLLHWLKGYHDFELPAPHASHCFEIAKVAGHAFVVVEAMRQKMSWDEILVVLESYKQSSEEQAAGKWKWV